jgi:6-phosphofructokinase
VKVTQEAITVWHVEAESAANGVGLIKLMGWSASHIALHTMLISRRLLPHPGGGLNKLP